jgi:hypothetical protein
MKTLSAAIAFACLAASTVQAQPACGDRSTILRHLEEQFGETVRVRALADQGAMIEIAVSPSGSWSVVATMPGRPSCLTTAGEAFEFTPAVRPAPGKPS